MITLLEKDYIRVYVSSKRKLNYFSIGKKGIFDNISRAYKSLNQTNEDLEKIKLITKQEIEYIQSCLN